MLTLMSWDNCMAYGISQKQPDPLNKRVVANREVTFETIRLGNKDCRVKADNQYSLVSTSEGKFDEKPKEKFNFNDFGCICESAIAAAAGPAT